jgi:hypothetical protein
MPNQKIKVIKLKWFLKPLISFFSILKGANNWRFATANCGIANK